jgi:protein SCO1/2
MTMHANPAQDAFPARSGRLLLMALVLPWLAAAASAAAPASAGAVLLDRLPAAWRDDQRGVLRLSDLHGRRVFVTMAYTTCHQVCPMTMKRLEELQRDLDTRGTSAEFLIVSYDPKGDDPDAWRRYRAAHGLRRENWHFLTGTPGDTQRLARLLGFEYWHYDEHVMHSYRIAALGGDGAFRGAIDSQHEDWKDFL